MATVLANTLKEPDRARIQTMVLGALETHPESTAWNVFILRIRGLSDVYVSVESPDAVVRFWIFSKTQAGIQERIRRDLPGSTGMD